MFTKMFLSIAIFSTILFGQWVGVDSQSADTTVIPSSKKSIFATSDADRVNSFISYAFEPMINDGTLQELAFDDFECGAPSKFRWESGFEIHSPYAPEHPSGGFEVEELESQYLTKWSNLMSKSGKENGWYYDAILDNTMTFWVTDLADYDGYNEDHVDRLYFQWEWNGKTYYSMFVHNGDEKNDLNQFELISDTFSSKTDDELSLLKTSEPRAYFDDYTDYAKICKNSGYKIVSIGIRRAVSDLGLNIEWYETIFRETIDPKEIITGETIDVNGNLVKYGHVLLDKSDGFTVTFYQRDGDRATYGDMSIRDIEMNMNAAHGEVIVNPFCCVDRWYDMHYAAPLDGDLAVLSVLENVMKSGERYLVYYNQIVVNIEGEEPEEEEEEEGEDGEPGQRTKNENKKIHGVDLSNHFENRANDKFRNQNDKHGIKSLSKNKIKAYGNEDPTGEAEVGLFWTLIEPNGQMVQIPGIKISTFDWSTESGSVVEMYVTPTYWDGEWCPMENTEDFDAFKFGDDIARIVIANNNDAEKEEADKQQHKNVQSVYDGLKINPNKHNIVPLLMNYGALLIAMGILILGAYQFAKTCSNSNNYIKTHINRNSIKYTYKTFQ